MKNYKFTEDWFSHNIPVWEKVLAPFKGKAVQALEIGCYEGRATCWLLENILTHYSSQITVIDTFMGSPEHEIMGSNVEHIEERFWHNIRQATSDHKVFVVPGKSQSALRRINHGPFQICYIDGSHETSDVFIDAAMVWPLIAIGGIIIFDDYGWCTDREWDPELCCTIPKPAIDAFLRCFFDQIDILERGYQIVVQKKEKLVGSPVRYI